jgi:hypothetical protein
MLTATSHPESPNGHADRSTSGNVDSMSHFMTTALSHTMSHVFQTEIPAEDIE